MPSKERKDGHVNVLLFASNYT